MKKASKFWPENPSMFKKFLWLFLYNKEARNLFLLIIIPQSFMMISYIVLWTIIRHHS